MDDVPAGSARQLQRSRDTLRRSTLAGLLGPAFAGVGVAVLGLALPPAGLITGAVLLVLGETTIGLGFIAPGETGLLVLGTIADAPTTFLIMWTVTTLCAVAGDMIGYAIGRR